MNKKDKILNIIKPIFYFLFPNKCPFCENKANINNLCSSCKKLYSNILKTEALRDENLKLNIVYASTYKGPVKTLLLDYKYRKRENTIDIYLNLLENNKIFEDILKNIEYITYIPTTKKNILKRGYDQAELIAIKIAKKYNKKYIKILDRNEEKESLKIEQKTLKREERILNIKNHFLVNKNIKKLKKENIKNILICDDIGTTLSTAYEAKRVINKEYSNLSVQFFVLAYTKI